MKKNLVGKEKGCTFALAFKDRTASLKKEATGH